jgi:Zn ribbon nucleic-acid-binding protein
MMKAEQKDRIEQAWENLYEAGKRALHQKGKGHFSQEDTARLMRLARQVLEAFQEKRDIVDRGHGNLRMVFKCPNCHSDLQDQIGKEPNTSTVDCPTCGFHQVLVWKDGLKIQPPTQVFYAPFTS